MKKVNLYDAMMNVPGLYQLLQAKILTENSEVPLTPGWGQSAAPPPGGNFGKINGGSRHTVDNFGKVTLPAPRADDEAFEDWYAEPIKAMAPPAEEDVSKSRHDFLMSLRGPKTSEKPPIKVIRFDPSQNKVVQPAPMLVAKEKPKSASDIIRDLQNSGKLPQVADQLKAQQNQSRRKPNQRREQEERAPPSRETKCRVGWSKTMEAPQEKPKLKLANQRPKSKAPTKEKPPQDVICFECGAEVSGKLFLHYKNEHEFSIEEFKAAMEEASCNFHGEYQPPPKAADKAKKKKKEPDLNLDDEAVMNDDTEIHSGLTVKQHAELKRQEDYEKLRLIQVGLEQIFMLSFHSGSNSYDTGEGREGEEETKRDRSGDEDS